MSQIRHTEDLLAVGAIRRNAELRERYDSTHMKGNLYEIEVQTIIDSMEPRLTSVNTDKASIRGPDGSVSSEFDRVFHTGKVKIVRGSKVVDYANVYFGIEVKGDLSKSKITSGDNPANEKAQEFKQYVPDSPFFIIGICHYNTLEELDKVSDADAVIGFGYIYHVRDGEKRQAEKMVNEGEIERLRMLVRKAIDSQT